MLSGFSYAKCFITTCLTWKWQNHCYEVKGRNVKSQQPPSEIRTKASDLTCHCSVYPNSDHWPSKSSILQRPDGLCQIAAMHVTGTFNINCAVYREGCEEWWLLSSRSSVISALLNSHSSVFHTNHLPYSTQEHAINGRHFHADVPGFAFRISHSLNLPSCLRKLKP